MHSKSRDWEDKSAKSNTSATRPPASSASATSSTRRRTSTQLALISPPERRRGLHTRRTPPQTVRLLPLPRFPAPSSWRTILTPAAAPQQETSASDSQACRFRERGRPRVWSILQGCPTRVFQCAELQAELGRNPDLQSRPHLAWNQISRSAEGKFLARSFQHWSTAQ